MRMPRPGRALRIALVCLALDAGAVLAGPATPLAVCLGGILAVSSSAVAQSGGYSRPRARAPSGGYGGGFDRRPSVGGGAYRQSSGSSFGAIGGDRAISRQAAGRALQDYRASQAPPAADRRPSTGWGAGAWPTAPLERRPQAIAPGLGGLAPRSGAWDAVLAWSLLNSLSRPRTGLFPGQPPRPALHAVACRGGPRGKPMTLP